MPTHLQRIGILSELFDRFISCDINDNWFYKSVRKRREYNHYYNWLMCKQNIHLTNLRKSIIKNYFLEYKLQGLQKKIIHNDQIDIVRNAGLKFEKFDLSTALKLMELALQFRPEGKGIQRKVNEYKAIFQNDKW